MEQARTPDPGFHSPAAVKKQIVEVKERSLKNDTENANGFVINGSLLRSALGGINLLTLIGGLVWVVQSYDKINHTIETQKATIEALQTEIRELKKEVRLNSDKMITIETTERLKKEMGGSR